MQIFVRGLGWNTYTIDIEPGDTVLTLKHRVQDKTGIRSWRRAHFGLYGYFLTLMLHAVDARLGEPPRAARTPAPDPNSVAARIRKRRKTPAPDPNSVAARVRKRRRS